MGLVSMASASAKMMGLQGNPGLISFAGLKDMMKTRAKGSAIPQSKPKRKAGKDALARFFRSNWPYLYFTIKVWESRKAV